MRGILLMARKKGKGIIRLPMGPNIEDSTITIIVMEKGSFSIRMILSLMRAS